MSNKKSPFTKGRLIAATLAGLTAVTTTKVAGMVAEPTTDKGCPPISDEHTTSPRPEVASGPLFKQWGGAINDASCVEVTPVHSIVQVTTEDDLREALRYAETNNLTVSLAGVRHSMGGHTARPNTLVIDMMGMNSIELNETASTVTVGPGATWHEIQNRIHPNFAVSAMQSTDIFSVGGSISVNAHGMDHRIGAVENSIRSLRVMLPDGSVETVSRTQNPDLYEAVVGGYGLIGIITEAELDVVPNDIYTSKRIVMPFADFPEYFRTTIQGNDDIGLMYTHLSVAPGSFLDEAIVYQYERTDETVAPADIPPLSEISGVKMRRFFMSFSKLGGPAQELRWWAEKYLEPRFESCSITRSAAQGSGEACFVARNEPMHDSVPYLYNNLTNETDILHEYFIPRERIGDFVAGLRDVARSRNINLLNASVRVVNEERGLLTYAPEPAFSVVLFINQELSPEGNEKMRADTMALIDLAHAHGGRFFLPYQRYYTAEQLRASYPTIDDFIAVKKRFDPQERLQSKFYEHLTTLTAQKS